MDSHHLSDNDQRSHTELGRTDIIQFGQSAEESTQRASILHVHISTGCNVCQPGIPITRVEMGTESTFSSCLLQNVMGEQIQRRL